jgi:hypothetical protein
MESGAEAGQYCLDWLLNVSKNLVILYTLPQPK